MKKLKDLCLDILINEGYEISDISPNDVDRILDVNIMGDYIKIKFDTSFGTKADLLVSKNIYKNWAASNNSDNKFKSFVVDFLSNSKQSNERLSEIVDDEGNIMADDDMPSNSNNTMVTSPKFDLEKIFKSFLSKPVRSYYGSFGVGYIVW